MLYIFLFLTYYIQCIPLKQTITLFLKNLQANHHCLVYEALTKLLNGFCSIFFIFIIFPNILNYKKLFLNYTSDSCPPPPHLKDLQQVSISFRIKFNSLLYLTKSYMIWILPLSAASFLLLTHCIPISLSWKLSSCNTLSPHFWTFE